MMQREFSFPDFNQICPDEKRKLKLLREYLRYQRGKWYCHKEYMQLMQFLNQYPLWKILFEQHPYRINTLLSVYCDRSFNKSQRLQAICENFTLASTLLGEALCQQLLQQKTIKLVDLTPELSIYLNINQIDPFEGFFSLSILKQENIRVYDASFTFLSSNRLLIASIQGPKGEFAQENVRIATKLAQGVRPMYMLVNVFKLLSKKWNYRLCGIKHKNQAKYRWNDKSKLLFNYDEFWADNGGILNSDGYWYLPQEIERKTLDEIASKKRSMYRKRYEMFDSLETELQKIR